MKTAIFALAVGAAEVTAFHSKAIPVTGDVVKGEFIVQLKADASLSKSLSSLVSIPHALDKIGHMYGNWEGASFKGFSLENCTVGIANQVADFEDVKLIEQGQMVYTNAVQENPTWGLDRVDQTATTLDNLYFYKDHAGRGVDMYTIDTGIRMSHEDFGGRALFGFTSSGPDADDRNGHGTHCSSTMAGTEWGVAKEANLFSVKVLGDSGAGNTAAVIAGIDWVNSRSSIRTKVSNLSLGGGASAAMDNAVDSASNVVHVVASGNSNANACNFSPARAEGAFTVNAMQQGDSRSSFSNFGECSNIFAPGTNVQAAWATSDTATNTISGTSMAAPHVAGVAALMIGESHSLTPQQVKDLISELATPNAISNAGNGSPNLLVFNDRDGQSTPSPPTVPPTTPPPTPAPEECDCSGDWFLEQCLDCRRSCDNQGYENCSVVFGFCGCTN